MKNITEYGRSMIEMLGVLAVIGVLSVGGFDLVTKMNGSRKASAVIDEIGSLALKVRRVAREYTYEPVGTLGKFVYEAKAYPSGLKYAAPDDENGTGDVFTGTDGVTYTLSANSGASFNVQVSNLTTDMCMSIMTTNWGSVGTSGFVGMTLSYNSEGDEAGQENMGAMTTAPMTIGEATTACTAPENSEDDNFTITFTFR